MKIPKMKNLLLMLLAILWLPAVSQTEVNVMDTVTMSPHRYTDLNEALKNPDHVWYLDLTFGGDMDGKLTTFPAEICTSFPNLRRLYIAYNKFSTMPEEIGSMAKLEYLDISGNYLMKKLPEGMKNLAGIKTIVIKDHKFMPESEIEKLRSWLPECEIISE